jgi:hypothetical protein
MGDENPDALRLSNQFHGFSIPVWIGFIGDDLMGPCKLPANLKWQMSHQLLQVALPVLLENVPFEPRTIAWFLHDSAQVYHALMVRELSDGF